MSACENIQLDQPGEVAIVRNGNNYTLTYYSKESQNHPQINLKKETCYRFTNGFIEIKGNDGFLYGTTHSVGSFKINANNTVTFQNEGNDTIAILKSGERITFNVTLTKHGGRKRSRISRRRKDNRRFRKSRKLRRK